MKKRLTRHPPWSWHIPVCNISVLLQVECIDRRQCSTWSNATAPVSGHQRSERPHRQHLSPLFTQSIAFKPGYWSWPRSRRFDIKVGAEAEWWESKARGRWEDAEEEGSLEDLQRQPLLIYHLTPVLALPLNVGALFPACSQWLPIF